MVNGNSLIEGENNATISINNANSDNAGLYYCQVSNGMDTKTFKILLTVNKVEDVTTKQEETTTKAEVTTVVNNTQQTTTATTQTTTNKANTTTVNGTQQTTQTLDAGTQTIVGTGKIKQLLLRKQEQRKLLLNLKK